jgi:hypothetical protein
MARPTASGLRLAIKLSLKGPDTIGCCKAHRQSPHPRLRARSQGPSLRRHYPASTVLRPCPTPVRSAAWRGVGILLSNRNGSPPITRIAIPTCCDHYPGGQNGCTRRLLPHPRGLPHPVGWSASTTLLSRPAQTSLALRPAGLLSRPRRPLSRGFGPTVTRTSRSSATRSIDNSLDGTFLHW